MFGLPNPYVIGGVALVIVGLCAGLWVQTERLHGAQDSRDAALERLTLAEIDAKRWHKATDDRDAVIANLNSQIDKITADAAASQQEALARLAAAEAQANATERALAKLKRKADAAPSADQPKALSPVARTGLEWLRCRQQAGPSADPAACAGKVGLPAD